MNKQRKFLIVDDSQMDVTLLRKVLQTAFPHATIDAELDIRRVPERLQTCGAPYDAIVLDHMMPGNGVTALQTIRQETHSTPIVVVTGFIEQSGTFENDPEVAEVLAKEVAMLPLDPEKPHVLITALRRCIGRRAAYEESNAIFHEALDKILRNQTEFKKAVEALSEKLTACQHRNVCQPWRKFSKPIAGLLVAAAAVLSALATWIISHAHVAG